MAAKPDPQLGVVLPLTKGAIQPADLRRYHGIRLELRGDGAYEVALNTLSGSYATSVSAGARWQSVDVPFSDLKKERGRAEFPASGWTGNDVVAVEIRARRSGGAAAWLLLDNVSFY